MKPIHLLIGLGLAIVLTYPTYALWEYLHPVLYVHAPDSGAAAARVPAHVLITDDAPGADYGLPPNTREVITVITEGRAACEITVDQLAALCDDEAAQKVIRCTMCCHTRLCEGSKDCDCGGER